MPIPQVVSAGEWRQAREELLIAEKAATRTQDALAGGGFLLNALLRDGEEVYRTYTTGSRGVDRLMFVNNIQRHQRVWTAGGLGGLTRGWPQ